MEKHTEIINGQEVVVKVYKPERIPKKRVPKPPINQQSADYAAGYAAGFAAGCKASQRRKAIKRIKESKRLANKKETLV